MSFTDAQELEHEIMMGEGVIRILQGIHYNIISPAPWKNIWKSRFVYGPEKNNVWLNTWSEVIFAAKEVANESGQI